MKIICLPNQKEVMQKEIQSIGKKTHKNIKKTHIVDQIKSSKITL